jgi:hypothetical protein
VLRYLVRAMADHAEAGGLQPTLQAREARDEPVRGIAQVRVRVEERDRNVGIRQAPDAFLIDPKAVLVFAVEPETLPLEQEQTVGFQELAHLLEAQDWVLEMIEQTQTEDVIDRSGAWPHRRRFPRHRSPSSSGLVVSRR